MSFVFVSDVGLQVMCVFALDAEKSFPSKALFVDYANLPEAVPEHVFPEHFGMAKELDEVCVY